MPMQPWIVKPKPRAGNAGGVPLFDEVRRNVGRALVAGTFSPVRCPREAGGTA